MRIFIVTDLCFTLNLFLPLLIPLVLNGANFLVQFVFSLSLDYTIFMKTFVGNLCLIGIRQSTLTFYKHNLTY